MGGMRTKAWTGFRSVLCPVDFSEPSRLALRYAAAMAARSGARLTVTYANDPLLVAAAASALHDRAFVKRSAEELRHFVDETFHPRVPHTLRLKTRVSVGAPGDEILDAAAASKSDLVVMGTHGLTGAGRLFLGSTTLDVLQRTKIPVLAIPSTPQDAGSDFSAWPRGRVVAAIELGRRARADVESSARIAAWLGSPLLLLHVVTDGTSPAWVTAALGGFDSARLRKAKSALENLAAIARRRVDADIRVVRGQVSDEIAALAIVEKPAFLMTTLRDRRGWFGARRGSVSYDVLSHVVVPVLACPQTWRPR
jgi:nucleotide-binding universal stress UspA family protein